MNTDEFRFGGLALRRCVLQSCLDLMMKMGSDGRNGKLRMKESERLLLVAGRRPARSVRQEESVSLTGA